MSKVTNSQLKPLKGNIYSGAADFSSLSANSFKLPGDAVSSLMNGIILSNVFITDSEINNSIIGAGGNNAAIFTTLTTTSDVILESVDGLHDVTWDSVDNKLTVNGNFGVTGCATIGNIQICKNTITAINTNGDINLLPNKLGTLNLSGPINNTVTSFGNFYTNLAKGNVTIVASDYINLTSNKSSLAASTFSEQTFSTVDGDFTINTDTSLTPKTITNIVENTNANVVVTTLQNSNVRVGDYITLSGTNSHYSNNTVVNGKYLVSRIIDSNTFLISTGNVLSDIVTSGSMLKTANNNINLNASQYINVPSNIPITFGCNLNRVSGNTSGMSINAQGNIVFSNPDSNSTTGSYVIQMPQYTKFQYGTSGNNNTNFDGTSMNINSFNNVTINGQTSYVNTPDVYFVDPNPMIGNFTTNSNDLSDRGVQFRYSDTSGNMKLGWFGYQQSTGQFTFLTNAMNNNELFSGDLGKFNIGSVSVTNITLNTGGILDMGCGTLANVKLITGCSGIVNINASQNVNISTANRIALISGGDIYIPNNIQLTMGTSGTNVYDNTVGSLVLAGSKNVRLLTQTNGSVIVPIGTKLSFDNTSIGNQSIVSDTSGNFYIASNKNLVINVTNGNLIFPQNNSALTNYTQNSIQFGNSTSPTQMISGNTSGINIISSSSSGTLNFIATSNVNISNSSGNIVVNSLGGDINLYATSGNVRILPLERLVFNTSNTSNSIRTSTSGSFIFNGPGTGGNQSGTSSGNTIEFKNSLNLNLNVVSTGNINIPTNVYLNIGNNNNGSYGNVFVTNDTANNMSLINNASNGNLNALVSNNVNVTSKNLSIVNSSGGSTNISTQNLIVSATSGSQAVINSTDMYIYDPNPFISNYTSSLTDPADRGIQFRYMNSAGSMKSGWFGYKQATGQFSYYSDSILSATEVVSGTLGQFALGSAVIANSLTFLNAGDLNMNCGTISNLNTITGCNGTVNINATSNINASATNILLSTSKLQLPYTTPLSFGNTQNSISVDTSGNMTLTALGGSGQLILNGNVQINGTTENVYSTVTNIQDPTLSIGGVTGPSVNDGYDRGIEFKWFNTNSAIGSTGSVIGFFGFQNSTGRFEYIPNSSQVNNVYYGSFGNVQFANGYFNNLDVSCGTISNVNTLIGCGSVLNIVATSNINASTNNLMLPFNSKIGFGNTANAISATSSGNLTLTSGLNTNIVTTSGGINLVTPTNGNGFVNVPQNTLLNFGVGSSGSTILQDTVGNLKFINSSGNIAITPQVNGSIVIPTNTNIVFSGTNSNNRISSDGTQLSLYGYSSVGIKSSTVSISGNVNVVGSISATAITLDITPYILPLGTSQIDSITSITNTTTTGNILITTLNNNYLATGDSVTLKNTDSIPSVDGIYIIKSAPSANSFVVLATSLVAPGATGSIKSVLTIDKHKDIGIAVDYWSTVGNTSITSGSANYKTGFFGWQNSSQRWVFYNTATIANDIVSGSSYGNVQINELFANKISGFTLDGSLQGGSFIIATSNLQATGGQIDSVPVGQNTAQSGRFTSLASTISTSLTNVSLQSTLQYSVERYTLSSLVQSRNPNTSVVTSFISVSGTTFNSFGTIGNTGIADGQLKKIVMSSVGPGCTHTLFFGSNKLITPNPLGGTPKQITFKRQGQSCSIIFDASSSAWILESGSGYIS